MNTNDPAATYSKPMLSDDQMYVSIPQPQFTQDESGGFTTVMGHSKWPLMGPNEVRHFYENLIHEGKLVPKEKYDELMQKYVDERLNKTSTKLSDMQDNEGFQGGR